MSLLPLTGRAYLFSLALLCMSGLSTSEIYKTVDKDGNISYTDNPVDKNADAIKLPPTNTQPAQLPSKRPSTKVKYPAPKHYAIQIVSPKDQTQVLPGQRDIVVSSALKPPLFPGHKVQVLVNGSPFGSATNTTSVTLKEIYRGAHQIQASVVNEEGRTISTSSPITIYVRRTSVSN